MSAPPSAPSLHPWCDVLMLALGTSDNMRHDPLNNMSSEPSLLTPLSPLTQIYMSHMPTTIPLVAAPLPVIVSSLNYRLLSTPYVVADNIPTWPIKIIIIKTIDDMSIPDIDLVSVAIAPTGLLIALWCVLPHAVQPQHAKPHTSSFDVATIIDRSPRVCKSHNDWVTQAKAT